MAINLKKGQTINLDKNQFDLSKVTIGLGWKIRQPEKKGGFFGKLLGGSKGPDFDLDAVALMLDDNGKVRNLGHKRDLGGGRVVHLVDSDVIFFNNLRHPSGHIWHTGDDLTGGTGGDDEQIVVDLVHMSSAFEKILFIVSIYQGIQKGQHFGQVEGAFIRAVDARGKEMARYDLSNEDEYNLKRSMTFGELYRKDDGWKFRAIGDGHPSDSFIDILRNYVYN